MPHYKTENKVPFEKANYHKTTCAILFIVAVFFLNHALAQSGSKTVSPFELLLKKYDEQVNQVYRLTEKLGLPHLPLQPTASPVTASPLDLSIHTSQINELYLLNPGDKLGIRISGKQEKFYTVLILPDGYIYLPAIGHTKIAGLKLEDAQKKIDYLIGKRLTHFKVEIHLTETRLIRLQVTGEVYRSGEYRVPVGVSLITVLHQAGGFLPGANIRDVEVYFADGRQETFDLYDALYQINAPRQNLFSNARIRLKPQTGWFAIDGEIPRPGLYQFGREKQQPLSTILDWAGTKTTSTDSQIVFINRLVKGNRRLIQVGQKRRGEFQIHRGDIITIATTPAIPSIFVTIEGEISRPGKYSWAKGLYLSDIIQIAGGLRKEADSAHCDVTVAGRQNKIMSFTADPAAALSNPHGENDPEFTGETTVLIRKNRNQGRLQFVTVRGEFYFPGKYAIEKNKTRMADILERAGGFTPFAQKRGLRIIRKQPQLYSQADAERFDRTITNQLSQKEYEHLLLANDLRQLEQISFEQNRLFDTVPADENPLLRKGDIIFVQAKTDLIFIAGRVGRPGGVKFIKIFKIDDYIRKAGGFTWDADKKHTKVIRVSGEVSKADDSTKLMPGDIIWVPVGQGNGLWSNFRDLMTVAIQLATIFLIFDRARKE